MIPFSFGRLVRRGLFAAGLIAGLYSALAMGSPLKSAPVPAQCQNVCDRTDPTTGQPSCHQVCGPQNADSGSNCKSSSLSATLCKQSHAPAKAPAPRAATNKAPPAVSTLPANTI